MQKHWLATAAGSAYTEKKTANKTERGGQHLKLLHTPQE